MRGTDDLRVSSQPDLRADGAPPAGEPSRPEAAARWRRWAYLAAVLAMLGGMAGAMVTTAVQQTPTIDEPVYVGAGASYLDRHSLRLNPEHPPLGKLVIGAGLAVAGIELDDDVAGDQGEVGTQLIYGSGHLPDDVMLAARIPVILLTLGFGLVVLGFARDVAGPAGGLVALALYSFSPDVIAHGSLATLDVPAAGSLVTAAWCTWRARERPGRYLPLAGLALGAALATRMNTLVAVPVLLALVVLAVWRARRRPLPALAAAAGVAAVAVAVVWASYLVVDPQLRWTTPSWLEPVHGLRAVLLNLMPFPEAFRDGMRIQFSFEDSPAPGYLFGRQYRGSLWYYLPAALLIKTPLGMLALWAAGALALLAVPRLRAAAPYVLLVPGVLFLAALDTSRDFGVRYVIFLPVFLAVAAAAVTAVRARPARVATVVATVAVAASSVSTFPYYLPYANEAWGGPGRTHEHLHDSNVDWGQDLGRLAGRLESRYPGERVWLVYKGSGVPEAYGIEYEDPREVPPEQVHGLMAVSTSAIARARRPLKELVASSDRLEEVGHSIIIYRRP